MAKKDIRAGLADSMRRGVQAERAQPVSSAERLKTATAVVGVAVGADTGEPPAPLPPPQIVEKVIEVERIVEKLVPMKDRVHLDEIKDRITNIRPVSEIRAQRFASSIAAVGLIQPPAIDRHGRLLAGDHRRKALFLLRQVHNEPHRLAELLPEVTVLPDGEDGEEAVAALEARKERVKTAWARFGFEEGIPVHRMDVDAEREPDLAKAIETVENTQRENFSRQELLAAYDQLVASGYREAVRGRPRAGEKPIRAELSELYGVSMRTVTRILAERERPPMPSPAAPDQAILDAQQRLKAHFPMSSVRTTKQGWQVSLAGTSVEELMRFLALLPQKAEN